MDGFAWDAVILAGGRGSRLGGVRKADLRLGGVRLLDRVLSAVGGARCIAVVGEEDLVVPDRVLSTRERPPFAGPAAGLAAGVDTLATDRRSPAPWIMVLGCDLPGVHRGVPVLVDAARRAGSEVDALGAGDPIGGGGVEWLTSIVRRSALVRAIDRTGAHGLVNCPMRRLLGDLAWTRVPVPAGTVDDVDTWADHERWTRKLA